MNFMKAGAWLHSSMRAAPRIQMHAAPADEIFNGGDTRPVILFDGVCNLCNGGVNFALDWDPKGRFRFAALQSRAGAALVQRAGRSRGDISSIVLVERDKAFVKSDAVLRIAQGLENPLAFLVIQSCFLCPNLCMFIDLCKFRSLGFLRLRCPFFRAQFYFIYDQIASNRCVYVSQPFVCPRSKKNFLL